MDREIKFRGMLRGGTWVYGGVVKTVQNSYCILSGEIYHIELGKDTKNLMQFNAVKYKTVGQYIELKDKNSREIYEGDIAEVECECGYKDKMPVEWGYNGFKLKQYISHRYPSGELEFNHTERVEVIGNIYENPELLK